MSLSCPIMQNTLNISILMQDSTGHLTLKRLTQKIIYHKKMFRNITFTSNRIVKAYFIGNRIRVVNINLINIYTIKLLWHFILFEF